MSTDEGNTLDAVISVMPQGTICAKREYNALSKMVSRWSAPAVLNRSEENRYRKMAMLARVNKAFDGAAKHALGKFLAEAKEKLSHGLFGNYLEVATDLPYRTAHRYILVATTFPDHKTVTTMGFEWCFEVAAEKPPVELITKIVSAEDREEANAVVTAWRDEVRVTNAFLGMLSVGDAQQRFGSDLAVDLSADHVVPEFRVFACELSDKEEIRTLLTTYRQLFHTLHGAEAVAELRRRRLDPTASSAPAPSHLAPAVPTAPAHSQFNISALRSRLDDLVRFDGTTISESALALAHEIDEKLKLLALAVQKA